MISIDGPAVIGPKRSRGLRIHYLHSPVMNYSKCGLVVGRDFMTKDKSKVTCKACLTKLAKEAKR